MTPSVRDLKIHHILPGSRTNGPGNRWVVWLQGCTLKCPGCFNPETHAMDAGEIISPDGLFERLLSRRVPVEGITVSGGEPLLQARPLLRFLNRVRVETGLSVILFSGFSLAEIEKIPTHNELFACLDVLISGRYDASQRLARDLRGSANKIFTFLTQRYSAADFQSIPEAEVVLTPDGQVLLSGIDPVRWG